LEEYSIDAAGRVTQRETTFAVIVENKSSKPVDLYWQGQDGMVWQGMMNSGETYNMNTYEGHTFFFTPQNYRMKYKTFTMKKSVSYWSITDPEIAKFKGNNCMDRHENCQQFAGGDGYGCEQNPGWMIVNCARTCNETSEIRDYCKLRDPKKRCTYENMGYEKVQALQPGDLKERFTSMVERFPQLKPVVLSEDPWVMQFDEFLTDTECNALFSTTGPFERSTDTGAKNELGESQRILSTGRTSKNAWCRAPCEKHPDVKSIVAKIVNVTGVPYENYESFQVLQYEKGQFYNTHHDRGHTSATDVTGGRILTFFLYCSDVFEGGETEFPTLKLKVPPRRGRAILWPSVKSNQPTSTDHRTRHGALPVIGNEIKHAANAWIHQHNFVKPNKWGCTGAFD